MLDASSTCSSRSLPRQRARPAHSTVLPANSALNLQSTKCLLRKECVEVALQSQDCIQPYVQFSYILIWAGAGSISSTLRLHVGLTPSCVTSSAPVHQQSCWTTSIQTKVTDRYLISHIAEYNGSLAYIVSSDLHSADDVYVACPWV